MHVLTYTLHRGHTRIAKVTVLHAHADLVTTVGWTPSRNTPPHDPF